MQPSSLQLVLLAATLTACATAQTSTEWPTIWTIGAGYLARSEITLGGTVERRNEPLLMGGLVAGGTESLRIHAGIDSFAHYLRGVTEAVDLDLHVWSQKEWRRGGGGSGLSVAFEGGRRIEFRIAGRIVDRTEASIRGTGRQTWRDSITLPPTSLLGTGRYEFFDAGLGVTVLLLGNIEGTGTVQCSSEVVTGVEPDIRLVGTGSITMLGENQVAAIYDAPALSRSVVVTEPELGEVTISPSLAVGAGGFGGDLDYQLAPQNLDLTISRNWMFVALPNLSLFSHFFPGDRGRIRL